MVAVSGDLAEVERWIRPVPVVAHQADVAAALADDLVQFRDQHRLDRTVVINGASTEPCATGHPAHAGLAALEAAHAAPATVLPTRSTYAYAAFRAGWPYTDFTPSTGAPGSRAPRPRPAPVSEGRTTCPR
ncbi:inositol-3-phosphate synthase [Streptomyces europaeiscabiei]|uniref:inositol-3-phosphate synthase n=1 Tax=Streptomyces europaeiscabiei TaxID=146819 RepID=UPI0029A82DE5|nr:inositol-3-phosphate synthase [Streptomyces europaeiscabiei]MDX3846074.1 inositol-3-phosphate synthase [Streptomyces europaeiscabiei]